MWPLLGLWRCDRDYRGSVSIIICVCSLYWPPWRRQFYGETRNFSACDSQALFVIVALTDTRTDRPRLIPPVQTTTHTSVFARSWTFVVILPVANGTVVTLDALFTCRSRLGQTGPDHSLAATRPRFGMSLKAHYNVYCSEICINRLDTDW